MATSFSNLAAISKWKCGDKDRVGATKLISSKRTETRSVRLKIMTGIEAKINSGAFVCVISACLHFSLHAARVGTILRPKWAGLTQ